MVQQNQYSEAKQVEQAMYNTDVAMASGTITTPFDNAPQQSGTIQQQEFQAQPQATAEQQNFKAEPQAQAQQQDFQAQPQANEEAGNEESGKSVVQNDPLANVIADNPWNSPEVEQELERLKSNKIRLNISTDSQLLPHVREFFKDENASFGHLTPHNLQDFNNHLDKKAA
ncbi:hypothetical protein ICK_06293 [Bacillus cereus BAG1X2-2]|nr:hypothetical protein ICK_06293 [Bacillus cereus BAG1X2-2]